jgi:hypothetical protein
MEEAFLVFTVVIVVHQGCIVCHGFFLCAIVPDR